MNCLLKKMVKAVTAISILSYVPLTLAGPPFITDDPPPVEYKGWEIILYSDYVNTYDDIERTLPGLDMSYGLLPNLELSLIAPYTLVTPRHVEDEDEPGPARGAGDAEVGLKYLLVAESAHVPQIAFAPSVFLPTGNARRGLGNGRTWEALPIWLQKSWGKWTCYGGGGYGLNSGADMRNFFFGGVVLQRQVSEKLLLGGEVFLQGAESNSTSSYTLLNLGGAYQFTEAVGLLFSVGHSVRGENVLTSYVGLIWST